jgi:type 1 fimbriae regulatory protein FimB/type 1 fimbriae regulatory protein FimE
VKRLGNGNKLLGFPNTFTCSAIPVASPWHNAGHDTRAIQDYLGHKAIQHTVRYTELMPTRLKDFWR